MTQIIKIENIDNDTSISISLEQIMSVVNSDPRFNLISANKITAQNKKCAIYATIMIGLATGIAANALYDIIKLAFSNHPSTQNNAKIVINEKSIYIKDVHNINNITINNITTNNSDNKEL